MGDVAFRKGATFAILEPLLAYLVAANVEVPYHLGETAKSDCARCNRLPACGGRWLCY